MAIRFVCFSCLHKLAVAEENAGKTATCPNCGNPILVPPITTESEEQEQDSAQPRDNDSGTLEGVHGQLPRGQAEVVALQLSSWVSGLGSIILVLLAVAFFVKGIDASGGPFSAPSYYRSSEDRFQSDNAIGATANALERIVRDYPPKSAATWFICGLLCWAILVLKRVCRLVTPVN